MARRERTGSPSALGRRGKLLPFWIGVALMVTGCDSWSSAPPDRGGWTAEVMQGEAWEEACTESPGCAESRPAIGDSRESVWRVVMTRRGADVEISEFDLVEVAEGDGVPVGPLSGDLLLVGLDASGEPVDGQLVRFPRSLRIEYSDPEELPEIRDLEGRAVSTVGYLRRSADIASIAVQDASGTVVASQPARIADLGPAVSPSLAGLVPAALAQSDPRTGLPPHCSHVLFLRGEADRHLAGDLPGMGTEKPVELRVAPAWALANTIAALSRMTPLLCQSVRRIAYGWVPEAPKKRGQVNSYGAGDLILINLASNRFSEEDLAEKLSSRLLFQQTVIHEAGHAAETLLAVESESGGPRKGPWKGFEGYGGSWSLPARSLARETIERVRLEKGFPREWRRLHGSFLERGWAVPYGSLAKSSSWFELAEGGFMNRRGAATWGEDIAYFVGQSYMAPEMLVGLREAGMPEKFRTDKACQAMQAHESRGVPSRLAAVYTKLMLLVDLGLVIEDDAEWCTGTNLGLPEMKGEGFHFYRSGELQRSFTERVKGVIGTRRLQKVFKMSAAGEAEFRGTSYPATLRLRLVVGGPTDSIEWASWPRGVYELGLLGQNNVLLRLEGKRAGNFDAEEGFVMVGRASNDRIAGSIFLTEARRLQAPLPAPQVFDPPLQIRFLMEN